MKVLLTLTDLYRNTGGGQTVYRHIIESTPDVEFWYFRISEADDAPRPANARTVPLLSRLGLRLKSPPPHIQYEKHALEEADAIARSVAGQTFDIAESPDFLTFGSKLRDAFARHGVKVGRTVLSLHGNISNSVELNWGSAGDKVLEFQMLERKQYAAADALYGISKPYIQYWQGISDRPVHYIDPAHFVFAKCETQSWDGEDSKPSLYCVGRSERRKGNDLFLELVRWLDWGSFAAVEHIGDADYSGNVSSAYELKNIAKAREVAAEYRPGMTQQELAQIFGTPAIVVIPTRYDTLNLVALEALFSGCPVAVSTRAGVCGYLDEFHPTLPYVKINLDEIYGSVPALRDLVESYDSRRRALHAALAERPPVPSGPLDMRAFYEAALSTVPVTEENSGGRLPRAGAGAQEISSLDYEEDKVSIKRRLFHLARRTLPDTWNATMRPLMRAPRAYLTRRLRESGWLGDARYFSVLTDSHWVPHRLRDVGGRTERNQDALKEKLGTLYFYASNPLYRGNFWLEIARVERLRGQHEMATAYELRLLRLLEHPERLHLLPRVTQTLRDRGSLHEAEAAEALYLDRAESEQRVYDLLKRRREELRDYQEKPFEFLDDRRAGEPKVAVIVSLYRAADKLKFFLTALAQQTLVRAGAVEVILVDSGSPADERAVFEAFHAQTPLSMLYARSRERETIQAAWNRGIQLAGAPYLVFLGADETLYPDALELLAAELDTHPETDWVMGNSLVTAVEPNGLYKHDIMAYDRTGAGKDHVYLETCYLSWVGGMYRRTIHDRCGYYDETFRGAGDTEFKNRVLPDIRVRYVDRMLGLFLNYPDGQTTASPMAEIEDSRAWYLHRSAGGVRYAFENRPVEDAEALLRLTLGYRKSYCGHLSSDVEYGSLLAKYILSRKPDSALAREVGPGLDRMLQHLRQLDFAWTMPTRLEAISTVAVAWRRAAQLQGSHLKVASSEQNVTHPTYKILNDNRHEQHSWLWKSNGI